ncbi:hypothetical protein GEO21_21340, partial [Sphingobacterium faecium]
MAIVNINRRMTSEYEKFQKSKKSNDSLIYVDKIPSRSPHELSLDLHVGDIYEIVNQNKKYKISEQGLVLSPGQSILIEINEFIEIPNNIFGIVTGKGSKIFQGIFISTGKIDAGFSGHLKIAIYNGSNKKITLKKEDSLCSCIFLNMDTTVSNN